MNQTEQTLLEQMHLGEFEIKNRKNILSLSDGDIKALKSVKSIVEPNIKSLVDQFYKLQVEIPEIALLVGDADTLKRMSLAQRKYVKDLFCGLYDLEYVNNRLRIGLVHKRLGVEPKLYLAAVHLLKTMLQEMLGNEIQEKDKLTEVLRALEKIMVFDMTLVFDTYIKSMVFEIENSKERTEQYARDLEVKVKERTKKLEELSRTDSLTELLNVRHLIEILTGILRAAQRRSEPVSVVYIDINGFKIINDTQGHQRGDEILRNVGAAIKSVSRKEDRCFRYGGDEFCIILPDCKEELAREIYSVRLVKEVQKKSKDVMLSIGITQTGAAEYLEPEELIQAADKKMYEAKKKMKSNRQNKESGSQANC